MKRKIVKFHRDDILCDYRQATDTLNAACARGGAYRVTGFLRRGETLIAALESVDGPDAEARRYQFAPFPNDSEDAALAEIAARFYDGFSFIAAFPVRDDATYWALFEKK